MSLSLDLCQCALRGSSMAHQISENRRSPAQQPTREAISDGVITARVRAALAHDPVTANYDIHVDTQAGVVHLTGFVETTSIRIVASRLAKYVDGVQQVDDSLDCRSVG